MMDLAALDRRPVIVALAGPNGAGKTTFYHSHLATSGLLFVNADVLAKGLEIDAYAAARLADSTRRTLLARGESFVFETVFSDPVGEKTEFLEEAMQCGYEVLLCYIGLNNSRQSRERVAMRVSQGGHDVPDDKLRDRFPRTLNNLRQALMRLPHVLGYDNSNLGHPYRPLLRCEQRQLEVLRRPVPPLAAAGDSRSAVKAKFERPSDLELRSTFKLRPPRAPPPSPQHTDCGQCPHPGLRR